MKTIPQVKKAVAPFTDAKLDIYRIDSSIVIQLEDYDEIDGMNADDRAAMKELRAFGELAKAMGYKVTYDKTAVIVDSYGCTNLAGVA